MLAPVHLQGSVGGPWGAAAAPASAGGALVVFGVHKPHSRGVKRALISALVLGGLAVFGPSCRVHKAGPAAHGAGYGAGLARQAVTLGGDRATRGEPMTGFDDPAHTPEPLPWSSAPTSAAPPGPGEAAPAGAHHH